VFEIARGGRERPVGEQLLAVFAAFAVIRLTLCPQTANAFLAVFPDVSTSWRL
jgi:hypothetical protein